eukprot:CAMPEP_0204236136 /NCGR_PEP_ID=MMETSP0361-20130328/92227_1 /ASSEMBLY_ACC=CAM_ASM_000343 /TAXON_ID=268821 /ORGANISM="Scrippsiella Hangoei, Strain SHTV-5" /LENGTH=45 /DNA_ID= /DNA_START= /DNA_END= /DNA_ORIENTATION=
MTACGSTSLTRKLPRAITQDKPTRGVQTPGWGWSSEGAKLWGPMY